MGRLIEAIEVNPQTPARRGRDPFEFGPDPRPGASNPVAARQRIGQGVPRFEAREDEDRALDALGGHL